MEVIAFTIGGLGIIMGSIGAACFIRLQQWEKHLRRTRIAVAYKGKWAFNRPILDWLRWAESIEEDKRVNGQTIYKQGGTTIVIFKPLPKDHDKTVTKTVKEKQAA